VEGGERRRTQTHQSITLRLCNLPSRRHERHWQTPACLSLSCGVPVLGGEGVARGRDEWLRVTKEGQTPSKQRSLLNEGFPVSANRQSAIEKGAAPTAVVKFRAPGLPLGQKKEGEVTRSREYPFARLGTVDHKHGATAPMAFDPTPKGTRKSENMGKTNTTEFVCSDKLRSSGCVLRLWRPHRDQCLRINRSDSTNGLVRFRLMVGNCDFSRHRRESCLPLSW
jgi:hypothetical protein